MTETQGESRDLKQVGDLVFVTFPYSKKSLLAIVIRTFDDDENCGFGEVVEYVFDPGDAVTLEGNGRGEGQSYITYQQRKLAKNEKIIASVPESEISTPMLDKYRKNQ